MSFIPKPNTGTLFINERRQSSDHPDLTGNIFLDRGLLTEVMNNTPEGELVKLQVSGWNNDGGRIGMRFGKPFVPKPKTQDFPREQPQLDDDSEIPF